MRFLRSLLIPLACILCLILSWYLMNDADQRFERERVGHAIELPSGNAEDLFTEDQAQLVSEDPSPSEMPVEPAEADESSQCDVPPTPGNPVGNRKTSDSETLPNHLLAIPVGKVDTTAESSASQPVALDSPSTLLPIPLHRASQSTVRFDRKDGSLLGCGVIVSTSNHGFDVLTANHLFAETEQFSITTFDRDSVEGAFSKRSYDSVRVMKRSVAMDLALVRVQSVIVPVYAASLAELGTPKTPADFSGWAVYCEGAGAPTSNKVSKAEKTTARRTKDAELIDYWKIERESVRGASGSGLFDDQGQLVGIASGNSRGFACYCHANLIAKFLKD